MNVSTKLLRTLCLLSLSIPSYGQMYRNIELDAQLANKTKGVRVVDYAKYTDKIPALSAAAKTLEEDWNKLVSDHYDMKTLRNVFFHDIPKVAPGNQYILPITAFGQLENSNSYAFVQSNAYFDGKSLRVEPIDIIALNETFFELNVSLAKRLLVMRDHLTNQMMVFPLGVGSFDEGVLNDATTILTPRFKDAYIDQWTVISERNRPRYFAGKPFIRITTDKDASQGHTAIGFHVQPNLDKFVRAFDSHGCMRMQLPDLHMLHDLLKEGAHRHLNVNVSFQIEDEANHPFPVQNRPYKKVLNVGNKSNPDYTLDRDSLVQTTSDWDNFAPVDELYDRAGDHHQEMFNYDTDWREKQKAEQHRAACYEQFPYGEIGNRWTKRKVEKDYRDCVEAGQRDVSIKDRIYKWWVH